MLLEQKDCGKLRAGCLVSVNTNLNSIKLCFLGFSINLQAAFLCYLQIIANEVKKKGYFYSMVQRKNT